MTCGIRLIQEIMSKINEIHKIRSEFIEMFSDIREITNKICEKRVIHEMISEI